MHIALGLPDSIPAGTTSQTYLVGAQATVDANTTAGLALIGATTIEGSALAHVDLQVSSVDLPDLQVPVIVVQTDVPASGSFVVVAFGRGAHRGLEAQQEASKGKDAVVAAYVGNGYTACSSAKVVITMVK